MSDALGTLINFAYAKGIVAESWAELLVVSIPKKGDLADMNNYRGISLMSTVLKVVCVLLSTRIQVVAEANNLFSRAQAGFRTREECITQVACVMDVIQRRRIVGETTYVVFVDLRKAYDTVPHEALFAKLSRFGIRGKCLAFIRALYRSSTIRVRVGGGKTALYSDSCCLLRGVRQGCPLSPTLFNIFIDDIAEGTADTGVLVPTGNTKTWGQSDLTIGCTLFADDAAGICASIPMAKTFCSHITRWCQLNEMGVGISKCGLMEFLPTPKAGELPQTRVVPGNTILGLELEGKPLPIVAEYMYLGILMTPGLRIADMVRHRIALGRSTVAAILPILRCSVVPMCMKLATVAAVVGPRLLFGAELYGMNRALTQSMQNLMNQCLRACIGSPSARSVPSIGLWKETGIPPICATAGARRARAFAKARSLKTWLKTIVKQPFTSREWTWSSGSRRWIERYALTHATAEIEATYAEHGWTDLDSKALSKVVRDCIYEREINIRRDPRRPHGPATRWYLGAAFPQTPLTKSSVGGRPKDQAGLALIVQWRINAFVTVPMLVEWNRMPAMYCTECPFCGGAEPETLAHIAFTCASWQAMREKPLMARLISEVESQVPTSEPNFEQTRLALLLGGCSDSRRVDGWMVDEPEDVDAMLPGLGLPADPPPSVHGNDDASLASSVSNNGMQWTGEQSGAITLARFLVAMASKRSKILNGQFQTTDL